MKGPETGGHDDPHEDSAVTSICSTPTRMLHLLWLAALICFCFVSIGGQKGPAQEGRPLAAGESQRLEGDAASQARGLEAMVRNILDFYFKPAARW